jgi:hypothetical protein
VSKLHVVLSALAAALVTVSTAAAVTGSEPDGTAHPYVGALVVDGSVTCSGVLVAPTVFATAGHCTASLSPDARVQVTFDTKIDKSSWAVHDGASHTHRGYKSSGADDLGVVVLDEAAPVTPAALPSAGSVESVTGPVTSVGYGFHGRAEDGSFLYDGVRRAAESPVLHVKKTTLGISTKLAGPCLGDSGGPQLRGDTVLSLTSAGAKDCSGKAEGYRLDTAAARAFLGAFLTLP